MEPSARHSYLLLAGCLWAVWARRVLAQRPIATPCKCSPLPTAPHSDLHSIRRPDRGEEFISVFLLSRWRGNPCLNDATRGQPPDDAPPRKLATGNSLYRRSLRYEPLEDRRLLAVVTVDTLADTIDFNDGHTSLREAIFATNTVPGADTINFAPALTANGPATILLTQGELKILDALTINGPGSNLLKIDASGNDPTPGKLDGKGSRIFNIDDGTTNDIDVSLFGLTMTGGDKNVGGAIRSLEGVSIAYCTISGNGSYAGGGIYTRGYLSVDHSTISGNVSGQMCGGIYSNPVSTSPRSLVITSSTIANNSALFGEGGGIRKRYGDLTIERSTISNNTASSAGGGMSIADGTFSVLISDSIISGNIAGLSPFSGDPLRQDGGGIFITNGDINAMVERSLIDGNRARQGGGIFFGNASQITVDSSTISNNSAISGASGIQVTRNLVLTNSTVSNNTGTASGVSASIQATIQYSTIVGNTYGLGFGGRVVTYEVYSSIIAGNSTSDANLDPRRIKSHGYNVIGSGLGAAAFNQPGDQVGITDPKLGPLADNGGVVLPDGSHILTHALLAGSPAINAGDLIAVAGVNGVPQLDERGTPYGRVFGGRIDIGAFEYQQPSDLNLVVDTLVDESDGNYSHGDLSLREAIELANMYSGPNYPGVVQTIHFDPALTASGPATILLTMGELKITGSMEIDGPGADLLTIDASGNDPTPGKLDGKGSRIFNVDDGKSSNIDVSVNGLTVTGGNVIGSGGAVRNRESLSLSNVVIEQNSCTDSGGGISNLSGNLTVIDSEIRENSATGVLSDGGGIASGGGNLTVMDSEISYNSATGSASDGGGVNSQGSNLVILRSVIRFNVATGFASKGGGINHSNGIGSSSVILTSDVISDNSSAQGGGVSLEDVNATVTACTITNNISAQAGGGIWITKLLDAFTAVNITGSMISENIAGTSGGGIACSGLSRRFNYLPITLTNCTISNNAAGKSYEGGGIESYGCRLTVSDSKISGNISDVGGGIETIFGYLNVLGTEITANSAKGRGGGIESSSTTTFLTTSCINQNSAGAGGGIYNAGSLHITNCAIEDNIAMFDGGGIHGDVVIQSSTISGNSAGSNGGGIYGSYYTNISNSTISGNLAGGSGGGIWARPIRSSLDYCTITQNVAQTYGGGLFVETGSLTLSHSIIASNIAYRIGSDLTGFLGANFDAHYCLVGDNANSGLIEAPLGSPDLNGNLVGGRSHGTIDPRLGPLAANGGMTLTQTPLPGSPAINAGDPSAIAGAADFPANDQRGTPFTRVYGGRIDIGAVESQPNPLPGDFNFNGVVDMADYVVWRAGHTTIDPRADANGDGRVDDADLAVWRANFGNTYASSMGTATAVAAEGFFKAPSKMMADLAIAAVAPQLNHAATGFLTPAVVASVGPKRNWSPLTVRDESGSFRQLLTLVAADRVQEHGSDAAAEFSRSDVRDDEADVTDSAVAAFDEAFATLGRRNEVVAEFARIRMR